MFRHEHLEAIQRAVNENNWTRVAELYNAEEFKNKFILDKNIGDQVLAIFSNKCQSSFAEASEYLLHAMVHCPLLTKRELVERLRAAPEFSSLDKRSVPSDLAMKATNIFTVMCANKCDYTEAHKHVNDGQPIPSILDALQGAFPSTKATVAAH